MKQAKYQNNNPQNADSKSRSLTNKQLIEYKDTLKLTSIQKEVLIGTLLGDASMSIRSGKPHYSVKFEQGESHKDYIEHLYQIFEPYTGSPPTMRFSDSKKTRKGGTSRGLVPRLRAYWFRTYRHKHFMYYYHLFYIIQPKPKQNDSNNDPSNSTATPPMESPKLTKVKIIPKNIHKYLTPRALAYWFMDDGTYHNVPRSTQKSYLFSTQGFEKHEVKCLCNALKYKFNIRANVVKDRNNWRIYILKESSTTFVDIIRPYIHQSFLYKI